jgi:hypothetical protein
MKYLRSFNESVNELETFCKNYLAELVDMGCHINVRFINTKISNLSHYIFTLRSDDALRWIDINDIFIPFLQMLSESYSIGGRITFRNNMGSSLATYDDVLNGKVDLFLIREIKFDIDF